jgi:hypothetical protein
MSKHHLIYFENNFGLSRPKSKSYSRLRLDETAAGRRSRKGECESPYVLIRPSSAYRTRPGSCNSSPIRGKKIANSSSAAAISTAAVSPSTDGPAEDDSHMAETVVAGWDRFADKCADRYITDMPASTAVEKGEGGITPRALVISWLNSAICNIAPLSARESRNRDPGPDTLTTIGSERRISHPLPVPLPLPDCFNVLEGELGESLQENFLAWKQVHLQNLSQEENAMLPLSQHGNPLGLCQAVHHHVLNPALNRSAEEFLHFIGWVTVKLNGTGAGEGGERGVCEYVRALHSASSSPQWVMFGPVVRANCSKEVWSSMVAQFSVNLPFGDGILLGSAHGSATATATAEFTGAPMGEIRM